MKYESFLTRKYLFSRIIPFLAVIIVAAGVWVLLLVMSVMEGFKVEMRDKIRGTLAHARVHGPGTYGIDREDELMEQLLQIPHVEACAPFVEAQAILKLGNDIKGVEVRGILPELEVQVGSFQEFVLRTSEADKLLRTDHMLHEKGRQPLSLEEIQHLFSMDNRRRMAAFNPDLQGRDIRRPPTGVLVGIGAVKYWGLRPGDVLTLTSYSGSRGSAVTKKFMVVGCFMTGKIPEDRLRLYVKKNAAAEFLDLFDEDIDDYRSSGIALNLDDYRHAEAVREEIEEKLNEALPYQQFHVLTWEDEHQILLAAVQNEKRIIYFIILLIVVFVSAIVVFMVMYMMVNEKTRDLGVLASLGATPWGVIRMFTFMSLVLSSIGAAIGIGSAHLFTSYINEIHDFIHQTTGLRLFPPDIYVLTNIPVQHTLQDHLIVTLPTIAAAILGSFLPTFFAARRNPIEALRYE